MWLGLDVGTSSVKAVLLGAGGVGAWLGYRANASRRPPARSSSARRTMCWQPRGRRRKPAALPLTYTAS